MAVYLISVIFAIMLMMLGERLPNQTKEEYIKQGHDWNKVIIYSNLAAIISGLISVVLLTYYNTPQQLNPHFIPFATSVTSYITIQSIMTDIKTYLINRNILRVAYVSMFIISVYNVTTNDIFNFNLYSLIMFTVLLILLFLFSPIGASDVRAIAVALPYTTSIGGYLGIRLLILSLLGVSIFMAAKRRRQVNKELKLRQVKENENYEKFGEKIFNKVTRKLIKKEFNKSDKHATPVGPFMILPFMVFLIIYPIIT